MEPPGPIRTPEDLKRRRKRLGLTQTQLADILGVRRNTVTRWEVGILPVPPYLHLALAGIEATGAHLRLPGKGSAGKGGDAR